ncbi:cingulin-like protein 1 isoform X2 [Lampris incognitus]|uniref:cingulin-like protein 1 isoform X2 n=1 Tax=Lampris incognitus TaxID=2546036 RepID=UPI0024B5C3A9|nr:cingulin-like protein 1 isoform X2 [Lampris incognitus]
MEDHRMTSSSESTLQRGCMPQHSPRSSPDNLFGVRVQVQGIKGHSYVVLNNGSQESHKNVSAHLSEYNLAVMRRPVGRSVEEESSNRLGSCRDSPSKSQRTTTSSMFNYKRHPEILKPYDPQNNNLEPLIPSQTAAVSLPGQLHSNIRPETTQVANVSKTRIPLPAEGSRQDQSEAQTQAPFMGVKIPARPPNPVNMDSISSVGKLIDQFNSPQWRGRRGPRNRVNAEDRKRSRSVDSNQPSVSSPPGVALSLTDVKSKTLGGTGAPEPPRDRFFSQDPTVAKRREESNSPTQLFKAQCGKEAACTLPAKRLNRVEKSPLLRSVSTNHTDESDERDAQVTPDILRGQQELSVDPNEDTAKQILFTYLKDGTTDNDSTTQMKVNLVFDKVNKLKWKTAENVEEEEEKDYAAEAKALQEKKTELEKELCELKTQLQVETKNERTLAKACEKARTEKKNLQEELVRCQTDLSKLRERLAEMEAELQSTKQGLACMKAERDRSKTEMKDLQHQLSEMHDELDHAKKVEAINTEKEVLLKEIVQLRLDFQESLKVQEEQEEAMHRRERELSALKGALKEEVETHDREMAALKEEYEQEVQKVLRAVEQAKGSNALLHQEKVEVEEERGAATARAKELSLERDQLKGQVEELQTKVDKLHHTVQESKALKKQLEQRADQLEREKQRVEVKLVDVRRKEDEMSRSNQSLLTRLEDVQSELTRVNHKHKELKERLEEERKQTEELLKTKSKLEEEKMLQDSTVEQLQRTMNNIMEECESSTEVLQSQVDEARERSQRELAELQKQLQEKGVELEKSRLTAKKLQEELLSLEEDLQRCRRAQQEAQLRGRQLEQRMEELEKRSTSTVEERARQIKLMEMDQIRTELIQERAVRQDLECDKLSLERQNRDLRGRVTHLEGSQRTNQDSAIAKLNSRIQELEEKLQEEEIDNNNLKQANRKLERKAKEMKMQVDEEHITLLSQSDQLTQRLKTVKRQMDEAEEEIERLEHAKKKLQRDLDEQIEANEQLHSQVSALRSEMRRKKKSAPVMRIVEDDEDVGDMASD